MFTQNQVLVDLVRPVVESMHYELWGLEHVSRPHRSLLRIYIDSGAGITVADCERVSREVTGVLDVDDPVRGPYDLEVSSPGLDRPLFTVDQLRRYAGQEVRVRLKAKMGGRRQISGRLESAEAEAVVIITPEQERLNVPPDLIEKARLVPRF